jgi:DNA-binding transcriptional ArsR family regulator
LRKQILAYIFASEYLHNMEARRDVFQAIADPTRRRIIGMLANETLNLNAIADNFDMSRQAISLHIKILIECGLVTVRQEGRERFCQAKFEQLGEVSVWAEQYRQFFERKFDSLEMYLNTLQKNKKHGKKRK